MNLDAIVLALVAIADLLLLIHFRKRHAMRAQRERVLLAIKYAVERANRDVEEAPFHDTPPKRAGEEAVAA